MVSQADASCRREKAQSSALNSQRRTPRDTAFKYNRLSNVLASRATAEAVPVLPEILFQVGAYPCWLVPRLKDTDQPNDGDD